MNTESWSVKNGNHPLAERHRRAERLGIVMRLWLKFDEHKEQACVADEVSEDGFFACTECGLKEEMLGKQGICHIHLGNDFFELPFEVARVASGGLGMHLLEGSADQFKMVLHHIQED